MQKRAGKGHLVDLLVLEIYAALIKSNTLSIKIKTV